MKRHFCTSKEHLLIKTLFTLGAGFFSSILFAQVVNNGSSVVGAINGLNTEVTAGNIQTKNNGAAAPLFLNPQGGRVNAGWGGIWTNGRVGIDVDPATLLHIGREESDLVGGVGNGAFMIGDVNGRNLAFDINEIQGRDGATFAAFSLNQNGGAVNVGQRGRDRNAAVLNLHGGPTTDAILNFFDNNVRKGGIGYNNRFGNDFFVIRAYNKTAANPDGIADRIRMPNGSDNIKVAGVSKDGFGPSEWVAGKGAATDLVCYTGSGPDEDGNTRARVEPCTAANSAMLAGVVIPDDESPEFGNPNFEFQDKVSKKFNFSSSKDFDLYWKKNHVGMELTGFRFVKAVGPISFGDLLMSSDISGHAMSAANEDPKSVVGSALGSLKDGEKSLIFARIQPQSYPRASRPNKQKLCIDNVCIDRQQLAQLLKLSADLK